MPFTLRKQSLVFAGLSLLFAASAQSTVFCVGTSQELSDALVAAQMDLNTNYIHLKTGRYVSPPGGFVATVNAGAWTIDGGYDEVCNASKPDAALSVLDGNAANLVLSIAVNGGAESLVVSNLSFVNGRSVADGVPAGLNIAASAMFGGAIVVDRNRFRNNVNNAMAGIGASKFTLDNQNSNLRITNNLFTGNQSSSAAAMTLSIAGSNIFVTNNTIVGNNASSVASGSAAVNFNRTNAAVAGFANNLLWSNTTVSQHDVTLAGDVVQRNCFERPDGFVGAGSSENFVFEPKFRGAGDFHLSNDPSQLGLGTITPPGGIPSLDLDGMPRVINGFTDIGAYGHELLFRDGFELIGE